MNGMFEHIKLSALPIKAVLIAALIAVFCYPVLTTAQKAERNTVSAERIGSDGGEHSESITNAKIRISIGQPFVGRHSGGTVRGFVGMFYRIQQAPRLESFPVTSAIEDTLYSYQVISSDANGDSILYALVEGPENMQIDNFGFLSWTPSQSDVGVTSVTIAVYDDRGDSSFQSWVIDVENINDPPAITLPDTLVIFPEDSSVVIQFDSFINDSDDPLDSLTLSAETIGISSTGSKKNSRSEDYFDAELLIGPILKRSGISSYLNKNGDGESDNMSISSSSLSSLDIQIDNETKNVTLTGIHDSTGTFMVMFAITDPSGSTTDDTTVIIISPVNDAPVVSGLPDITFFEDSSFTIDLDDFVSDVDNENSELNWSVALSEFEGLSGSRYGNMISPVEKTPVEEPIAGEPGNRKMGASNIVKASVSAESNLNDNIIVTGRASKNIRKEERESVEIILEFNRVSELNSVIFLTSLSGDTLDSIMIQIDSVSHVATLSAPSNYFVENIAVVFTATDPGNLSDADTSLISVEPVNDPPSNFALSYPLADTLNTLLPSFSWHPSIDVDPDDRIEYRVIISSFETLESPLLSELLSDTFYTLSVPLADDSLFYWSVMANDSSGRFAFSDTVWFLVDNQESPLEFSLISPEDFSSVDSLRPLFTWFSSDDPDPRDTVRYTLVIMSALDSDSVVYSATGLEDTSHQVTEDIISGSYEWFIIAEDADEDSLDMQSIEVFSLGDIVGVDDEEYAGIPEDYGLFQNYPNPFNPTTTIIYALPLRSDVTLEIYNIKGELVARIHEENRYAGYHEIRWHGVNQSGRPVASGLYIYRLSAGSFVETKKMLLLK